MRARGSIVTADAFTDESEDVGWLLATHPAAALASAREIDQLGKR